MSMGSTMRISVAISVGIVVGIAGLACDDDPVIDSTRDSASAPDPSADAEIDAGFFRLEIRQDGRPVCSDGYDMPPSVFADPTGVDISAFCPAGAVVVHLAGEPASGRFDCAGVEGARPCPQSLVDTSGGDIAETTIGEATGEARISGDRLRGDCICVLPPAQGLPGRRMEASFDVLWPGR